MLYHLSQDIFSLINTFLSSKDFIRLWITGAPVLRSKLLSVNSLSLELPIGTWNLSSTIFNHLKHLRELKIGFVQGANHCLIRGLELILSMKTLSKLDLDSPRSLPSFHTSLDKLFPLLNHLRIRTNSSCPIESLLPLPSCLRTLHVLKSEQSSVPLYAFVLLDSLPNTLEVLHFDNLMYFDDAPHQWPASLTDLKLIANFSGPSAFSSLPDLLNLSIVAYYIELYGLEEWKEQFWKNLPTSLQNLDIVTQDLPIAPDVLNDGLVSLKFESSRPMTTIAYSLQDFYEKLPNLEFISIHFGSLAISPYLTQNHLSKVPKRLKTIGFDTGLMDINQMKSLPDSIVDLQLRCIAIPLSQYFLLPSKLTSLRIFSPHPLDGPFPETVTILQLRQATLSERVFSLPSSLTKLISGIHTLERCNGFAVLPNGLKYMDAAISTSSLKQPEFDPSMLPKSLNHLKIATAGSNHATEGISWHSRIPADLPLHTLIFQDNEYISKCSLDLLRPIHLPESLRTLQLSINNDSVPWTLNLFKALPRHLTQLKIHSSPLELDKSVIIPLLPKFLATLHLPYWTKNELTQMLRDAQIDH